MTLKLDLLAADVETGGVNPVTDALLEASFCRMTCAGYPRENGFTVAIAPEDRIVEEAALRRLIVDSE